MPTGYTSKIADGISFEQFALNCARAIGALIMMRDEPADAPIPQEFKPSTYHSNEIVRITGELKQLEGMTEEEAAKKATEENRNAIEKYSERVAEKSTLRKKYDAMLVKVKAWTPPSPDHEGLKKFMIEQIESSIKFDCNTKYNTEPEPKTGERWKGDKLADLAESLAYHTKGDNEERERVAGRNLWVKQLRESLPHGDK